MLLRALCDLNRHVRQRAAWTLARMHQGKEEILEKVVATEDNYALQAFLSELERCDSLDEALDGLGNIVDRVPGAADVENVAAVVREHFAVPGKAAAAALGQTLMMRFLEISNNSLFVYYLVSNLINLALAGRGHSQEHAPSASAGRSSAGGI